MRKALLIGGAGLLFAAAGLPATAAPKLTARTVTNGFVRSNVLLPIGGKKEVVNPVPRDLSDLSGWTHEELEVGLEKQYEVDVVGEFFSGFVIEVKAHGVHDAVGVGERYDMFGF